MSNVNDNDNDNIDKLTYEISKLNLKEFTLSKPSLDDFEHVFGDSLLAKKLYKYIYTIVQDDKCEKRQVRKENPETLKDIMCDFSLAYVPLPKGNQLLKNKELVEPYRTIIGRGEYGMIMDSGDFETKPIITKIELRKNATSIQEIYMNMVIINQLIIHNEIAAKHLVPTFGIFACPSEGNFFCTSGPEKMFIVQEKKRRITLEMLLNNPNFTLDNLKYVLERIFSILIMFEESKYKIAHHDLHAGNIMINPENLDNLWIIDYGLSSFTVKDENNNAVRYPSEFEYKYDPSTDYHGGLYDLFFLMSAINSYTINRQIETFTKTIINSIIKLFRKDQYNTMYLNPYDPNRFFLYIYLKYNEITHSGAHEHNVNVFKDNTYRKVCTNILSDLEKCLKAR